MGHKSKRYFHQDSKSRSADHSRRHERSSGSKSVDNKSASEQLKQAILNKSKSTKSRATTSISIEDQIKRADQIAEINTERFEVKQFTSSRPLASNGEDLLNIPLPVDYNSWKENPVILIHPKYRNQSSQERVEKWKQNLEMLKKVIGERNENRNRMFE